jgi:hypothetical protein
MIVKDSTLIRIALVLSLALAIGVGVIVCHDFGRIAQA